MTEEEAKQALFDIHFEYMTHTPREREKLYEEYIQKRGEIRKELIKLVMKRKEKELKKK